MSELRRGSALPLYHQIANVLRARILSSEWAVGEQIPSENSLAATFGVSTLTVRQSLSLLQQEGLLARRQGSGTFVEKGPDIAHRVRLSVPFHEITSALADLPVSVIDVTEVRWPADIVKLLGVDGSGEMTRIRRVRMDKRHPMSYAISYLPLEYGRLLSRADLSRPLLVETLEAKFGIRFIEVYQTVEATLADPEAAKALEVQLGAPLLLVRRTYEVKPGVVRYVAVNQYPSHLFRYEMRLGRQDSVDERPQWNIARTVKETSVVASRKLGRAHK
jgi:GntR family transcriptional regulator